MARALIGDEELREKVCKEIADFLMSKKSVSMKEFEEYRKLVCEKYELSYVPSKAEIFQYVPEEARENIAHVLRLKPVRTASGIAVIAVMAKPHPCPHGACIYCPGGVKKGTAQSYTGKEPASMRALENRYDAYEQVKARIAQLKSIGHRVEKAELIIIGGSFLNLPLDYQRDFFKGCFDALNEQTSSSLEEALSLAERARIRNVGFTLETRPDLCDQRNIDMMLSYGITRVELGVQALDDRIYEVINRGHKVKDVVEAFRLAKDSGLKVVAHMMPGLPSSDPEKDLEAFRSLFDDSSFKPDMLKVYPCLVLESTPLYELYRKGLYQPYDESIVIPLLADVKKLVPRWVRIMRVQREIPAQEIVAGVKCSNLRELVLKEAERRGHPCRCIRCREAGLKRLKKAEAVEPEAIRLLKERYEASDGLEVFLSYEDVNTDTLIGFLRLRIPSPRAHRQEVKERRTALVRELHVYGRLVPLGERDEESWQHRGYGALLMSEAERIAREDFDCRRILVMSAVGTREYYRRLGYEVIGPYMGKELR